MTRKLMFVFVLSILPIIARGSNLTLEGDFTADDNAQLFSFSVLSPAAIDIRSFGYAGGTTSTGTTAPSGGFDTILTLFSSSGVFIDDNDEGAGVATDPATGLAADARIRTNLNAGSYILALTQYDNFSIGNLADGFTEIGHPNFTADPSFATGGACPGNMFRDISGTAGRCRTGNWALDFVNVTSATAVPEPGTTALFGAGLLGFALLLWRKRGTAIVTPVLLAAIFSTIIRAQAPDYSNVTDFLNGKRIFLAIDDVVVAGITPGTQPGDPGQLSSFTLQSANSQLTPPTSQTSSAIPSDAKVKALTTHMLNTTSSTPLELTWSPTLGSSLFFPSLGNAANVPFFDPPSFSAAAGAAADFNQDGLDEVVLNYSNGETLIGSNLTQNAEKSVTLAYGPISTLDALADMVIGDFNGDGRPEIAGLVTLPSGGLQIVIYTVDPTTLAVSSAARLTLQKALAFEFGPYVSITAGRFTSLTHDQIVVADGGFLHDNPNGGDWLTKLELLDFSPPSLVPQETTTTELFSLPYPSIKVRAGRFGLPANHYQQVVYASMAPSAIVDGIGEGYVGSIQSIDPATLAWKGFAYTPFLNDCAYDMTVGNFDNQQPDPLNPGQTEHNLNDQFAVLHGACGNGGRALDVWQANSQTLKPSRTSITGLPSSSNNLGSMSITPSDTQGRSLLLGQPTKITISQPVQPSVVIGAPPMHVDWISPDPLDNVPEQVMNLSADPDGFNTTYDVENTTDQQSGITNSTSWSLGTKTSVGGFIQFGDPDVAGLKINDMSTAAQELKHTAEQENGSYTRSTYNIYQATGFGDQVSYTDSDFNIWVYPVIGRTVCTAATPNCSNDQKVPLTIQFSAPNGNAEAHSDQGQSLQWYQPPWEPGNIFSYPASFDQLQSIYGGNLAKLTTDGLEFVTDTSRVTQKTTWAVGTNSNQTASVEQNYSSENDFSAEASASFLDTGGGASVGYDVSGSNGFSNLSKSASDLGTSTGISISKPGTFPSFQSYGYSVSPYILGTVKPGGLVDNQPLSTDVRTFGLIRSLFTADPLTTNSGGWWAQAYNQAPDVALNHPSRWSISTPGLTNPVPTNCLATGTGASQMDCAELSFRAPKNPWLSSFHQMRGFFISNANSPGQGPQLEQAQAGDVLTLQARVYNYSLAQMPSGSKVHVRFYFQPWKGTVPLGESVLIGEPELDPIPPFNDVAGQPANWVLASTTFDTSKYDQTKAGDAYVAFWVVVWIQAADGTIVPEMPGHGLTSIPGTLTSMNDAATLEQIASDKNSYDNNVGFFKQAFYIGQAKGLGTTPPAARQPIEVGKADVSAHTLTPHDTITVSATLMTSSAPVSGITAAFYDGDPQKGGRRFGAERVPYIAPDTSYDVATTYRTNSCGTHQLFVVVNEAKAGEIVRRAHPVRVDCKGF